jgi:hypothetical protein
MMGAASRNLPEPSACEYVGRVFSQHREELEWLANFLTGDETIAAACLVDACALAESENPRFQELILKCACLATIRSAVQIQQRRIVQLSLVICGLERRSAYEAAALLGIDPASVEGAYCAAIESLEVISCEQFQRQNDSAAVYN